MTINKEPAVIIGGIAEILRAIPPALIVFSIWNPTNDQQMPTILLFVGLFIGLAEKLFIRSQVTPTMIANAQIEEAIASPANTTPQQVINRVEAKNEI